MDSLAFILMSDFSFCKFPAPLSHISMLAVAPPRLALQKGCLLFLDHLQQCLDSKGAFEVNSWLLSKPLCISENILIILVVCSVTNFSWGCREKSEREKIGDGSRRNILIYSISLLASYSIAIFIVFIDQSRQMFPLSSITTQYKIAFLSVLCHTLYVFILTIVSKNLERILESLFKGCHKRNEKT